MIAQLTGWMAPFMPVFMLVAVAGSVVIGWVAKAITVRVLVEKVRRLSRSVRVVTEQRDAVEEELAEERRVLDQILIDYTDTKRALRAAVASPAQASPRHMTIQRIREIAERPLPGESTGAHAAITQEDDRG